MPGSEKRKKSADQQQQQRPLFPRVSDDDRRLERLAELCEDGPLGVLYGMLAPGDSAEALGEFEHQLRRLGLTADAAEDLLHLVFEPPRGQAAVQFIDVRRIGAALGAADLLGASRSERLDNAMRAGLAARLRWRPNRVANKRWFTSRELMLKWLQLAARHVAFVVRAEGLLGRVVGPAAAAAVAMPHVSTTIHTDDEGGVEQQPQQEQEQEAEQHEDDEYGRLQATALDCVLVRAGAALDERETTRWAPPDLRADANKAVAADPSAGGQGLKTQLEVRVRCAQLMREACCLSLNARGSGAAGGAGAEAGAEERAEIAENAFKAYVRERVQGVQGGGAGAVKGALEQWLRGLAFACGLPAWLPQLLKDAGAADRAREQLALLALRHGPLDAALAACSALSAGRLRPFADMATSFACTLAPSSQELFRELKHAVGGGAILRFVLDNESRPRQLPLALVEELWSTPKNELLTVEVTTIRVVTAASLRVLLSLRPSEDALHALMQVLWRWHRECRCSLMKMHEFWCCIQDAAMRIHGVLITAELRLAYLHCFKVFGVQVGVEDRANESLLAELVLQQQKAPAGSDVAVAAAEAAHKLRSVMDDMSKEESRFSNEFMKWLADT